MALSGLSPLDGFEVVVKPIADLLAARDPDNPRYMPDGAMARLVSSITEYGFVSPVLFNQRTGRVVGGHQRIEAAEIVGLDALPCVIGDWSEEQEDALNIALNASYGEFDELKLSHVLQTLKDKSFDLDLTSLPPFDIEAAMANLPEIPTEMPSAVRKHDEKIFRVTYTDEDEPALLRFLGRDKLPASNLLGDLLLDRIRALTTQGDAL